MPSQITRIVESDFHVVSIEIHGDLPRSNQLIDQLSMMDDLVIPAKGWVFILDRMQTMRAGRYDSFRRDLIQYLNVLRSQPEENILTSCAARGVTCASFVLPPHGIIDARR